MLVVVGILLALLWLVASDSDGSSDGRDADGP